MSKNSSAKYYQDTKERLQKKLVKDIKVFLKKEKKGDNTIVKDTKIYLKTSSLSIEKKYYKMKKNPSYYNYTIRNLFFS